MKNQFPIDQFRLALKETSRIKAELKPFFVEFQNNNMLYIVHTVQQLYTYLTDKNTQLHLAFNSLFAVKFMVDNADFIVITMIEAYLLPKILQIASFELNKQNNNRGDNYFIMKGFKGEKNIFQYYGFNFIRIACELIMACAQIKPKKLVYNQQINEPSDFQITYRKLKLKGFKPFQSYAFYKEKVIKQARNKFVSNLKNYSKDIVPLSEYVTKWINEFLLKGTQSNTKIHPLKLVEKGQAKLSLVVTQNSVKSLKSVNLKQRRRALKIVNQMVKWGLIIPYFQINFNKYFRQIIQQITPLQGKPQKQVGLASLSHYLNNDKEKKMYYRYLLQSIRLWSVCYPYVINVPHKQSYIKSLAGRLENTILQLPKPQRLFVQQTSFLQSRMKKQQINNSIMRNYLLKAFKQQISKARKILRQMYQKPAKIQKHFSFLREFQQDYEIKIANSCFNTKDMQQITTQGVPIFLALQKLIPLFQSYIKNNIPYKQLKKELFIHNNNLNFSNIKSNYLSEHQIQSEDQLSGIYQQSEVCIIVPQSNEQKEFQPKQEGIKLQKSNLHIKNEDNPIENEPIAQKIEKSEESFRCFQLKKPIQSLIGFYEEEAKPSKIQIESMKVSLDMKKTKDSHQYFIKDQFSEIISPFVQPKEQSFYTQGKVTRNCSFMECLLTDQHQIIPQKKKSSLKLINSQQLNMPQIRGRSKSINNRYKEILKSNESSSRPQTYQILAIQSMAARTQMRSQYSNADEMKIGGKSTGTPYSYQRYNEFFQVNQAASINRERHSKIKGR